VGAARKVRLGLDLVEAHDFRRPLQELEERWADGPEVILVGVVLKRRLVPIGVRRNIYEFASY
jgi:hypothetical protein